MAWYSAGTIQVAANGTTATGTGTAFLGNVRVGDGITIAGSTALHEVTGVTSNTQLTFSPAYAGSAGSGKTYRVSPILGYDKDLSDAFNAIRLQWGTQLSALQPWAYAASAGQALMDLGGSDSGRAVFVGTPAQGRAALALGSAALLAASSFAQAFLNAANLAAQRAALSLTPASGATDETNGAVWVGNLEGMFGLGGRPVIANTLALMNAKKATQFFYSNVVSAENPYPVYGSGVHIDYPSSANRAVEFFGGVNGTSTRIFYRATSANDTYNAPVEALHSGNSSALPITGSLSPATDNNVSYGVAARRPSVIYAGTGTINTSDAREKSEVRKLTDAELSAAKDLASEIGAYRWLAEVERKGDEAREHIGMTVQRAIEVMESHGLDPFNYGFICYDAWEQETVEHPAEYEEVEVLAVYEQIPVEAVHDEDGNEVEPAHFIDGAELEPARFEQGDLIRVAWTEVTQEAGDRYSFRMDELYAFIAAGANQRTRALEERLARLEAAISATE